MVSKKHILIIKLGALGDVLLAQGAMHAIKMHHQDADITVVTSPSFVPLIDSMGVADTVIGYNKKSWGDIIAILRLIIGQYYSCIYDLQTSTHSKYLYYASALWFNIWNNHCQASKFFHANPNRNMMHTVPRLADQLFYAGIDSVPNPTVNYMLQSYIINQQKLPKRYALLVTGSAPNRPKKRWNKFAALAQYLYEAHTLTPILLGTDNEADIIHNIMQHCPYAINMMNKTNFSDIACLARHAVCAVGNDTGPMHIIALANCQSLVLFGDNSSPDLCAPYGKNVTIIQRDNLYNLPLNDVAEETKNMLHGSNNY